jgi:hypothetical protein
MRVRAGLFCLMFMCFAGIAAAQPANGPKKTVVKTIPPAGIDIPARTRSELNRKRVDLDRKIATVARRNQKELVELLPDVEIFSRAVELAISGNTFFKDDEFKVADQLLNLGLERIGELMKGTHSWTQQSGLVVRGYRSRLDDTVQPYGLVIGPKVKIGGEKPVRCDIWFRGRSEKGPELQFIHDRLSKEGEYKLEEGIMLHPLGRYCNANRFAGEVDVFEALEHAKKYYPIDADRISVRGFSMGGASCWGFTVHYPSLWFASNPGAGFSETKRFLHFDMNPDQLPPWYQQKLWNLYDAEAVAGNLADVPTVAYSGEVDGQKMAADIMVAAAAEHELELIHIIGPMTGHKIHPESKAIIEAKMNEFAKLGRVHTPAQIRFATFTLKYNRCAWLVINGLGEHWQQAHVDADLTGPESARTGVMLKTENVTDLSLEFATGENPFAGQQTVNVVIDGQTVPGLSPAGNGAFVHRFRKEKDHWQLADSVPPAAGLVKRHNLQGPIDDALMDSFLFVKPTSPYLNAAVGKWVNSEFDRAVREWERQMRGTARIKKDTELTEEDIRDQNLILWGCPKSNQVIKKIADRLPIHWDTDQFTVGERKFDPGQQALIMIYPNPLNPDRYVVINSSLTYREFDYENNARQTPKLPDWAIVDFSEPPSDKAPGKIVAADFFDEQWKLKPPHQN